MSLCIPWPPAPLLSARIKYGQRIGRTQMEERERERSLEGRPLSRLTPPAKRPTSRVYLVTKEREREREESKSKYNNNKIISIPRLYIYILVKFLLSSKISERVYRGSFTPLPQHLETRSRFAPMRRGVARLV